MSEARSKYFNYPILITGGAGFLGSDMIALCLEKQVDVVVIDNSSNSDLFNWSAQLNLEDMCRDAWWMNAS